MVRYVREGTRFYSRVGTGFAAYSPDAIWTNAHVVEALRERLDAKAEYDPVPAVVRAGTAIGGSGTYEILGDGLVHPDYDGTTRSEDIGLLTIDGTWEVGLNLLPRELANGLQIGQPVGTLGFPGELGLTKGEAERLATPTFKDGVISALRAIGSGEAPHVEVQYNFDISGGTSGSPVIDHDGWVIAVSHAATETRVTDTDGDEVRVGIGSLNFGIRIDEVWDLVDHLDASGEQPLRAQAPPRPHPGSYQPFPENWNGETAYEP